MDASLRLRFAQHDKTEDVIPHTSEESSAWMLHFACASFSMTAWVIARIFPCHSECREQSSMATHPKGVLHLSSGRNA